jgi:hypothetical protein
VTPRDDTARRNGAVGQSAALSRTCLGRANLARPPVCPLAGAPCLSGSVVSCGHQTGHVRRADLRGCRWADHVVDAPGRQGVVFRSMEVSRPDAVLAARLSLQLPYLWSHLTPIRSATGIAGFQVRRRVRPRLTARVEIEIGEVLAYPSALDVFLTARWGSHTRARRGTIWVPITHPPFRLHQARLLHADKELLAPAGIPMPDEAPVGVLWSPGLDAQIGRPRRLNG